MGKSERGSRNEEVRAQDASAVPHSDSRTPNGDRFRSSRAVVELGVLVLVVGLMVRTWLVQGVFCPVAVVSGSMAEGLLGAHRDVVCAACGRRFCVGTDLGNPPPRVACPNCGFVGNEPHGADLPGDRVLLDRSALLFHGPRRFDVVAFHAPQRAADVFVKRVVGLPGESVQVRDGELYVDGQMVRKSLAEQRAVAVLVHDACWAPATGSSVPRPWQARASASRWQIAGGKFLHPGGPADQPADWCQYRHWTQRPGRPNEFELAPIDDHSAYNQGWSRRLDDIRPVADLRLSFRVADYSGPGVLLVEIGDGQQRFTARLDLEAQRFTATVDGHTDPILAARLAVRSGWPFQVEVSLVDQQFLVAIDGCPLGEHLFQRTKPPRPDARPVAIGVSGLRVELDRVCLYRDVYYSRPIGMRARWGIARPYRLGPDEYFVLGDNSPASDDSRSWPNGPGVPSNLLIGRPLVVLFSSRSAGWFGGRFQLPDLSRIRYIH
jgi:signal peptidase I